MFLGFFWRCSKLDIMETLLFPHNRCSQHLVASLSTIKTRSSFVKKGITPIWISKLEWLNENETSLYEALEMMLNLSMLDENHATLVEGGIPAVLKELNETPFVKPQHKRLIEQILWKLDAFKVQLPSLPVDNQLTVMVSYNWDNQPVVVEIANRLKEAGYKVWLDLDEMVGSSVETMATAVETSQVVLMCLSRKYKESPNCRLEGEYAFKRRKTIIPLLMQPQYDADGWLGAVVGTKIYYKFTHQDHFEAGIEGVLKELRKLSPPS